MRRRLISLSAARPAVPENHTKVTTLEPATKTPRDVALPVSSHDRVYEFDPIGNR